MRILFYVEPVTYRCNPLFLTPHINNLRCFINANLVPGMEFALASSPVLCREYDRWLRFGGSLDVKRFPVSARTILAPYDFDRAAYSRDLYADVSPRGDALWEALDGIRRDFAPDLVLSVSQNTYLRRVFSDATVLFFETGPLPRHDGSENFYFDAGGLHRDSVLETGLDRILSLPVPDMVAAQAADDWRAAMKAGREYPLALGEFRRWLSAAAGGRKVVLIATQPHDWIAIEGAYRSVPGDALLMQVLEQLPSDWVAVATFHRDDTRHPLFERYLEEEYPNFIALPDRLTSFGSDPFLPAVDAVATISSKTALTAALFGKRTISLGQSFASGFSGRHAADLDRIEPLTRTQCGRMLCFLSNRFSFLNDECFQSIGFLADFFQGIAGAGDARDFQLDIRGWRPDHLARVMPS